MNPFHKTQGDLCGFSHFIIDDDKTHWDPVLELGSGISEDYDYIINSEFFVSYIVSSGPKLIKFESNNLLFRKNKIYAFRDGGAGNESVVVAIDELGNRFNMMDVWHSVFYFLKKEDLLIAERFLKLKNLE